MAGYAIISLGGKQYRVAEGDRLLVDRVPTDEGKTFHPDVLFTGGNGKPNLSPRIQVTLATGISEERCRRVNLGYLNSAVVNLDDWRGRESQGVVLIPRAGETLYRLKQPSAARAS